MRKRFAVVGVLVAAVVAAAAVAVGTASGGRQASGTILIGISAAKTGILAPYDLQAGQLFQMRINQINKAGDVLGKQVKVEWIDTKSDKPTAAANANELISKGAVAIIATFVWALMQMVRLDATTFSTDAYEVARIVLDGIDCPTLREREGQTTTDLRQRGDRRYHVTITWRCRDVQIEVRAEDGRMGVARGPRLECCPEPGPSPS